MKQLPATEGIKLASTMLHNGYFAEVAGKNRTFISCGINHSTFNGKPYWFTEDDIQKFQTAMRKIGSELILVQMSDVPNTKDDDPYCGGSDWVDKFATLRTRVDLKYLFSLMGKNRDWYYNRLSAKTKVYNKFKPEDIELVNRTIHKIAIDLCSIELTPDIKQ